MSEQWIVRCVMDLMYSYIMEANPFTLSPPKQTDYSEAEGLTDVELIYE